MSARTFAKITKMSNATIHNAENENCSISLINALKILVGSGYKVDIETLLSNIELDEFYEYMDEVDGAEED